MAYPNIYKDLSTTEDSIKISNTQHNESSKKYQSISFVTVQGNWKRLLNMIYTNLLRYLMRDFWWVNTFFMKRLIVWNSVWMASERHT